MRSGAARINLGDMARTDVPARIAAIESLAKRAPEPVDAWGWKGGKPGELTGGDYMNELERASDAAYRRSGYSPGDSYDGETEYNDIVDDLMYPTRSMAMEQFAKSKNPYFSNLADNPSYSEKLMQELSMLEAADIPREWTGRVLAAIGKNPTLTAWEHGQAISDAMRGLTKAQREDFIRLLPRSRVSPARLAETVRRLD